MKKFQVIALSLGGLGNRVFSAGETVTEKNFPEGNAPLLVEQGFLKEIEVDLKAEKEESDKLAKEEAKQLAALIKAEEEAAELEAENKLKQEESDRIAKEEADALEAKRLAEANKSNPPKGPKVN